MLPLADRTPRNIALLKGARRKRSLSSKKKVRQKPPIRKNDGNSFVHTSTSSDDSTELPVINTCTTTSTSSHEPADTNQETNPIGGSDSNPIDLSDRPTITIQTIRSNQLEKTIANIENKRREDRTTMLKAKAERRNATYSRTPKKVNYPALQDITRTYPGHNPLPFIHLETRKQSPLFLPKSRQTRISHYFPLRTSYNNTQKKYDGFNNLGNTCYLNSVIRSFVSLEPLVTDLQIGLQMALSLDSSIEADNSNWSSSFYCALIKIIAEVSKSLHEVTDTKALKEAIGNYDKIFAGYGQQDAHEFFLICLDVLQKDLKSILPSFSQKQQQESDDEPNKSMEINNDDFVDSNFMCILDCQIECIQCKEKSVHQEVFYNLSLEITDIDQDDSSSNDDINNVAQSTIKTKKSVDRLLTRFFKECDIERKCSNEECGCEQAKASCRIARYPKVLVLHLKRFKNTGEDITKSHEYIELRNELNLHSFGLPFSEQKDVHQESTNPKKRKYDDDDDQTNSNGDNKRFKSDDIDNGDDEMDEEMKRVLEMSREEFKAEKLKREVQQDVVELSDENKKYLASSDTDDVHQQKQEDKEHAYVLSSVVCHIGATVQSGHYTCDVFKGDLSALKSLNPPKWKHYDDAISSEISQQEVLEGVTKKKCGYLFFYVQKSLW